MAGKFWREGKEEEDEGKFSREGKEEEEEGKFWREILAGKFWREGEEEAEEKGDRSGTPSLLHGDTLCHTIVR